MVDVYADKYYKMYDYSRKVENHFENFALITYYNPESKEFEQEEVKINDLSLVDIIECKTPNMVSVVLYTRSVGLIDDILFFGQPENVGRTIYFGETMSVAEYNVQSSKPLLLPLDKMVCKLDCGEVLTELETYSDTSNNVLVFYKGKEGNRSNL